jgi:hypothetical protein
MTTANLPGTVFEKLASLRRRLTIWFIVDGAGRLAVALVALALISFGLDRLFRMDLAQRSIVLLAMTGVVGWIAWRRIINPLRRLPDDDALAIQVETRHRELGDALISSMQLARLERPETIGASPALVAEAIRSGAAAVDRVPFDDVIDHRKRNQVAAAGGASLAALALLVGLFPGVAGTWAQRNLMLSPTTEWPQETRLIVVGAQDNTLTVPRGDDMRLKVTVEPGYVVPSMVHIDYRTESGARATEQMAHVGERGFQATFRNVLEPFSFRVRGNDDRTERHAVRLVERPVPETLAVQVTPPAYTGEPTGDLTWVTPPEPENEDAEQPAGADTFYVLEGSTLRVTGRSNKPVAQAHLVRGPETLRPITVADDARTFDFDIRPDELADGTFGIRMTDTNGLASKRPARFAVRVRPDEPPNVQAELRGIGDMITNVANIPVELRLRDDHGLVRFGLAYHHTAALGGDAEVEASQPRWIDLQNPPELPATRVEPFEHVFDAEPLSTPVGTHLVFHFAAVDNDAVGDPDKPGRRIPLPDADAAGQNGEPYKAEVDKVGRSTVFSLKVVEPETLRDELLRQEGEQRLEFDRLRKSQEDLRTEAQALRAPLARARADDQPIDFTARRMNTLAALEKDQRLMARRCRAIRDSFDQIRLEYRNNKLEGENQRVTRRLTERVIEPLAQLADEALPAAADQFDLARKTTRPAAQRLAALDEAVAQQAAIARRMEQILEAMVKMEGFQAAINLTREVLEAQLKVTEMTEEQIEQRVQEALEKLEGAFD